MALQKTISIKDLTQKNEQSQAKRTAEKATNDTAKKG